MKLRHPGTREFVQNAEKQSWSLDTGGRLPEPGGLSASPPPISPSALPWEQPVSPKRHLRPLRSASTRWRLGCPPTSEKTTQHKVQRKVWSFSHSNWCFHVTGKCLAWKREVKKESDNYLKRLKELSSHDRQQVLGSQFSKCRTGFKFRHQPPASCMNMATLLNWRFSFVKGAFYYLPLSEWLTE